MTERLRQVMALLAALPDDEQDAFAIRLEAELRERQRIAAQLATPKRLISNICWPKPAEKSLKAVPAIWMSSCEIEDHARISQAAG